MRFLFVFIVSGFILAASYSNVIGPNPALPQPDPDSASSHSPKIVGWKVGESPKAPTGFKVNEFAGDLHSPRKMYVLPNNDVLVSEATGRTNSRNRILIFRGLKSDGTYDKKSIFLENLNQPFGMLLIKNNFYVANTDSIYKFMYKTGDLKISSSGTKILDLPSSGYHGHWTRNLITNPEKTKIYVAVGSGTNIADDGIEKEIRRADILEINLDGSGERIYASGLRNPIGLAFYPGSETLWAVVNERDNLGDNLVPDYMTHIQKDGFYGWPYAYYGQHEEPRLKGQRPDLVKGTITPDFSLGSHTASLSVNFYEGKLFPKKYRGGVFIGQHGSWNSSVMRGYDVYFVPFANEKPLDVGEPFLTGFIADDKKYEAHGRPVDTATLSDGSLLVSDDEGGKLWRVTPL